jgi:nucleotide-binding universal stress UspA family protein
MKILVGVDDSPHSQAALTWVKRMAWPAGTHVEIVSVARPVYAMMDVGGMSFMHASEEGNTRFHEELAARVERDLKGAGLLTQAVVLQGDPREAIVQRARDAHADLVVVGSHGRSGISKLMMGSVASHIVTHAPCNVLVVKLPA